MLDHPLPSLNFSQPGIGTLLLSVLAGVDGSQTATRREFFGQCGLSVGALGLATLLGRGAAAERDKRTGPLAPRPPHFTPKAKAVIYLFMAGGPPHMDILDPKPFLEKQNGQELPDSVRGMQRITLMTRNQKQLLVAASPIKF